MQSLFSISFHSPAFDQGSEHGKTHYAEVATIANHGRGGSNRFLCAARSNSAGVAPFNAGCVAQSREVFPVAWNNVPALNQPNGKRGRSKDAFEDFH